MSVQITEPATTAEATYKAEEVEGFLDRYFYRKIGFRLAKFFARLKVTPAAVSVLGGLCGVIAGHLYYYHNLSTNIVGMALHVWANALDNADGQLARLLGARSREGRVIDSLADHLVFVSIYVHLALRCVGEGASPAIFLLALAAGISHGLQGAAADYYRTSYLYFVKGKSFVDLDSSEVLRSDYCKLTWHDRPRQKFLLAMYFSFMRPQEMLSPQLKKLRKTFSELFPQEIPESLKRRYQMAARPMFKLWGLLMTNTRMLLLFLLLLIDQPVWYFWFQVSAFNLLLACLLFREEIMSRAFLGLVTVPKQK